METLKGKYLTRICYREQQLCEDDGSPNILKTCLKPNAQLVVSGDCALCNGEWGSSYTQAHEHNNSFSVQRKEKYQCIMQDSSMSETTALHTQQLSWKQPMHSTLLLFFLLLLHLFTCQEFPKSQHFSTLTQEEIRAPPRRQSDGSDPCLMCSLHRQGCKEV